MIEKLRQAIATGNKREIDRWGVQVQREVESMMVKLEKQFHWLDPKNMSHEHYEKRFAQWESLLHEYQDAVRLLNQAEAMV